MDIKDVTLYKKDNTGEIRVWSIRCWDWVIIIEHGQLYGSMQQKREHTEDGKAGRNRKEQIMSRMASRIGKQRDKGYVPDLEDARVNKPTNTLGMKMPMLAQKFKNKIPDGAFVQYKYDGNRCMITKQNGKVFAYSRQGKVINSIDHILKGAQDIPEGTILDGELYHHGTPLQTLRSWIARGQAESLSLVYMCYDVMRGSDYRDRYNWLMLNLISKTILIAPTIKLNAMHTLSTEFKIARASGYEGLIIRDPHMPYEDGKRSRGLLKVKEWQSDEYQVIDIIPSKDNWAILVCRMLNGRTFKLSCHGTITEKTYVLDSKQHYIGRMVTVEYANLTKDGIPFHPVSIAFTD